MKAFLMYQDHDFDLQRKLPSHEPALTQDLELNILFNVMACGDQFLYEVVKKAVLTGENDVGAIRYRQSILKDCLKNPAVIRDIYTLTVELIEKEKKSFFVIFCKSSSSILYNSVGLMQIFVDKLKQLRAIVDEHTGQFDSEGFIALFTMLKKELSPEYFASIQNHLRKLKFRNGVLISAELGAGNEGRNYILRKPRGKSPNWLARIFTVRHPVYGFHIDDRDESGGRALAELRDRGINLAANALAQSTDHIRNFFTMLRTELAFYVGCLNLYERLAQIGAPVTFPLPLASSERSHVFKGLYDVCLALTMKQKIVGNDLGADHKNLVIITGANQGGKSTFMRSIGLAQLMMQCGMFVSAEQFSANICGGLFTHYKREEDATMKSGKLDEELGRMNDIVDSLTENSLLLFNESFAATNEREGAEIAGQIVSALIEKGLKVFFVTHLYGFAHGFYTRKMDSAIFLRAERQPDGRRTFKIAEGEPLQTSFGQDLYYQIFGNT
jgi:DNA mismatch repair ATPase MutS